MLLRQTHDGCTVLAPAKLNLCLQILGRLPDGYHQLRTLMCPVRWFDTVQVCRLAQGRSQDLIELQLIDPHGFSPADKTNLAVRALEELRSHTGCPDGARISLTKRIPSQAGLGGGSSDAAAALIAGNRVWDLGLTCRELQQIGEKLGSDIPFFVHSIMARGGSEASESRWAVCSGKGEEIVGAPSFGGAPCVIVKPKFGLSTVKVYRESRPGDWGNDVCTASSNVDSFLPSRLKIDQLGFNFMGNALQAAALRIAPEIERIVRLLDSLPAVFHQLSGSGSAYFAIFRTSREAQRVAAVMRAQRLGTVFVSATC